MKKFAAWALCIALAVALGLILRFSVVKLTRVTGDSMNDTLEDGDIVLAGRLEYRFGAPRRGDVALMRVPGRSGIYLKRVIGLPGEVVEGRGGRVFADGQELEEPYAHPGGADFRAELGEGEYFVLGDQRGVSYDSREEDFGVLTADCFLGKVRAVIWPLAHFRIGLDDAAEGESALREGEEADNMQENQENQASAPEQQKPSMKKRVLKEIREWVVSLAVALLIVFLLKSFLFTVIRVDGHSMDHTLADGERLVVSVLDVKLHGANRGDVVICHYPGRTSKFLGLIPTKTNFVKRVVAVAGDTVFRKEYATYVTYGDTGETVALDEEYASRYPGENYEYTLQEGEYFVVGDNRGNSHDSRDWKDWIPESDVGPITEDMLVGKVRWVFWPLNHIRAIGERVE